MLRRAATGPRKASANGVNGSERPQPALKAAVNGHPAVSGHMNGVRKIEKPLATNGKSHVNGNGAAVIPDGNAVPDGNAIPDGKTTQPAANGTPKTNGRSHLMVNGHSLKKLTVDINRSVLQDQKLVQRCISGEATAWTQMYQRFHGSLLASIRAFLGRAGQDIHLVDEISARVWYSLVRNGFELLAKFDVKRGCRLSTFLSVLAKTQARMLLRAERRRKTRECLASRHEAEEPEAGRGTALSDEEFIDMLSPAEREFYFDVLIAASGDSERYTRQNLWQLRHRVRRKLELYLE